ncbi:hypothetical protein MCOR27_003821 [Pyricularia oryzae]|uniref:DUF2470 domain-containing protein n=1 Tax=Pyricularia grisea TaxID=148305 RepID=A0ABQ8N295_PYRGI|nr:hypothetical protein MCOR19_000781 [Pyricularia oryzae]KAI6290036.1 hypothetical protein MCOR33_011567 [Pyricularia grisea]KAI6282231.1 hypothetical protein MCOR27_003821 [Pyricularia oryzae]KAI6285736.1 hypothetical protein MCOR26_001374 [Pyricularia oryzae]KAI6335801.1 hypothetical protein MCOR28_009495 [Pyricularia oryzae]
MKKWPPPFLERRGQTLEDTESEDTEPDDTDDLASFGGHGTLEALEFTRLLEAQGIPSCVQGVSALIYYGAGRVRDDWEICIPTEQMEQAKLIFENSPDYEPANPILAQPKSLIHSYPRLKRVGINVRFILVPAFDIHFEFKPESLTRSFNNLPYPKLEVLVQSLLERNDSMNLTDLVDGADLSEKWGEDNLNLEGKNDGEWVAKINATVRAMAKGPTDMKTMGCMAPTVLVDKRELWLRIVRKKGLRLGWKRPPELFATRFRLHGEPDPWLRYRECC